MADTDGTRDLFRRWIHELWNSEPEAVEELAGELLTDGFVGHWPDRDVTGPRALAEIVKQTHEGFDQLSFVVTVGPIVDGDLVAGRWAGEGENADGPVRLFGNDILRVEDGKLAEFWVASGAGKPSDQKEPGLAAVELKADQKDDDPDDDTDGDSDKAERNENDENDDAEK